MNHIPPASLYDEFIARIDRLSTHEQINLINALQARVNSSRNQHTQSRQRQRQRTERDLADLRRKRAKDYMIQSYK